MPGNPQCLEADTTAITQADQDAGRITEISALMERRTVRLRRKVGNNRAVDSFDHENENNILWQAFNNIANAPGDYLFQCTNAQFCTEGLTVTNLSSDVSTFTTALSNLSVNAFERANKYERALRRKLFRVNGLTRSVARRRAANRVNRFRDELTTTTISAESQVQLHVANFGFQRFTCSNANVE